MNRGLVVTIVLCFLGQILGFAQTYQGRVTSREDGSPIEFANIVILSADSSYITGGITDELGKFKISIGQKDQTEPAPKLIKTSSIGYEPKVISLEAFPMSEIEVVLDVLSTQLQDVLVIGKKKAFSLKDDGTFIANVSSIPLLVNSGSIDDLLNRIPFVQGSGGSYTVLGTGGSATVYLNGQKVQDVSVLQRLRSQDIASVEVINTPGVQYKASTKSIIKINTIKKENNTSISANQYLLMQNNLSAYTGINISHGSEKSYWNFNIGYSYTAISMGSEDYYSTKDEKDNLLETLNNSDIKSRNDFLMTGLTMNYEPSKNTNLGFATNLNVSKSNFDIFSKGLKHIENGEELLNTPITSKLNTKPLRSTSSIYYNGRIGKTDVNVTDEFLLGRTSKDFGYYEDKTSASVTTEGKQNFIMNSAMISFKTPIKNITIGYGSELTLSANKSDLMKDEEVISTGIANSSVINKQTLFGAYFDIRAKWNRFSAYGGIRYEYEKLHYEENGMKKSLAKPTPHFLSPTISLTYSADNLRSTLSYRRSINRPSYASLNNFIIIENQYVYQQGNPLLFNQTTDLIQLLASYKNISLNASYNFIHNTATTALEKYSEDKSIILKRTINIPNYTVFNIGLNWRDSFGFYSPSLSLSFQKQFLEYDDITYNKPRFMMSTDHYFDFGQDWRLGFYASYISKSNSLFVTLSERWNYRLMLSKSYKGFTFDLNLQNLFLDNKLYRTRAMAGIFAQEIEFQDFSGVSLNISYRFNSVRPGYRNRVSSSEGKRF